MSGTIPYLVLSEVAEHLGHSHNTMKAWDQQGLVPDPDATFGHLDSQERSIRAWNAERVAALMGQKGDDGEYRWKSAPIHYLTIAGVAELLGRPPSTVKWWASDLHSVERAGATSRRLPPPDAVAGRSAGWLEETILTWSVREGDRSRPRAVTGRSVYVLIQGEDGASLAGAQVVVFDSEGAAQRELAQRYRETPGADLRVSEEEAAARYLAAMGDQAVLRESVVYR